MFCIKKVLNNNAVQAVDLMRKEEVIIMGKGVGFGKKVNQPFELPAGVKKYHLQKKTVKGPAEALLKTVDPIYIEIADAIIKNAEDKFGTVDNNILLPLADHIAFSQERLKSNMQFNNPFTSDIRMLFEEEYAIAKKGKAIIEARTGRVIPEDEVSYIALYVHLSLSGTQVSQAMKLPAIIHEGIRRIENECHLTIDRGSYAYHRLFYHIRCMLMRVNSKAENPDIVEFMKSKHPYSYEIAAELCRRFEAELRNTFNEEEIAYLALHIERIRTN